MTTISVPLNPKVEKDLNELVEITGANRVSVLDEPLSNIVKTRQLMLFCNLNARFLKERFYVVIYAQS